MEHEQARKIPADQNEAQGRLSSRRQFLRDSAVVGVFGTSVFLSRRLLPETRDASYDAYQEFVKGWDVCSDERVGDLLGYTPRLLIDRSLEPSEKEDGILKAKFTTEYPTRLVLKAIGEKDPNVSMPVVKASFKNEDYAIPIVQTENTAEQEIPLGYLNPGEYEIDFTTTNAHDHIGNFEVELYGEYPSSKIYQAMMDNLPKIAIRADNAVTGDIDNDMPFFTKVRLRENKMGQIMIEYWQGYTAEDGGTEMKNLYRKTPDHRVFDYDLSRIVIVDRKGKVKRSFHQEDTQKGDHQIVEDQPLAISLTPGEVIYGNRYHSVDDHGMLRQGYEPIEVQEEVQEGKVIFITYPEIMYKSRKVDQEIVRARKILALREHRRERLTYLRSNEARRDIVEGRGTVIEEAQKDLMFLADALHDLEER